MIKAIPGGILKTPTAISKASTNAARAAFGTLNPPSSMAESTTIGSTATSDEPTDHPSGSYVCSHNGFSFGGPLEPYESN